MPMDERTEEERHRDTVNMSAICCAIILPPLGVFIKFGVKVEFWICLVLTILGWIPGMVYALYIVIKEQEREARGNERREDQRSVETRQQQPKSQTVLVE